MPRSVAAARAAGPHRARAPRAASCVQATTGHCPVYGQCMLTLASRADVMNRLGRAMADPTRSRILLELLRGPGFPGRLAESLGLTRTNVSNHLACLRGCGIVVATPEGRQTRYEVADPHLARAISLLVDAVLAYDDGAPCADEHCDVPLCCDTTATSGDVL